MHAQQMIATHPQVHGRVNDALARCIESCFDCAQTCTSCADACLGEESVAELVQCIRLDLDCADVCAATGAVASRQTADNAALMLQMLETCAAFCRLCAEECEKHAAHHEHCRLCAETCRQCERACHAAATATGLTGP
jgi:hypothetical protein